MLLPLLVSRSPTFKENAVFSTRHHAKRCSPLFAVFGKAIYGQLLGNTPSPWILTTSIVMFRAFVMSLAATLPSMGKLAVELARISRP
jgi:uncharacterized membrane protein YfbV (UPF0208 family)